MRAARAHGVVSQAVDAEALPRTHALPVPVRSAWLIALLGVGVVAAHAYDGATAQPAFDRGVAGVRAA